MFAIDDLTNVTYLLIDSTDQLLAALNISGGFVGPGDCSKFEFH
jgi:hypothetical protein